MSVSIRACDAHAGPDQAICACAASGYCRRFHDVLDAIRRHLDGLPESPPDGDEGLGKYAVAVGEALACRDEIQVLQRLSLQKGFELQPSGVEGEEDFRWL